MLSELIAVLPGSHNNEHVHSLDTIENTIQILHHLNTIERYYIHAEHTANSHLNDDHTMFPNKIFDSLLKTYRP
jgi:hypothetical protein